MKDREEITNAISAMRGLVEAIVKKYISENVMFTSRSMALSLARRFAHSEEDHILLKEAEGDIALMRQASEDTMKILKDMVDASNDLGKELPRHLQLIYHMNVDIIVKETMQNWESK